MKLATQWKLADRRKMPVHTFLMPPGESVPLEIKPFAEMGALALAAFPHRHTFYEILYVTGGRGTHVVDFESRPIRPPALWFISPGQVHFWNTTQPLQGQALLFTGEFLRAASGSEAGVRELAFFHRLEGAPELRLKGKADNDIAGVMRNLADEYRSGNVGRVAALRAWLQILLIKAQRLYAPQEPGAGPNDAVTLARRFKQLVAEQFIQERSVSAYARKIGVSTGHLHELVKRSTGFTPQQIIRLELVLEAKRLLAHSELTVAEISYRLAFEDPAYFGRFFKREAGSSPGDFRQRVREKHQNI